MIDDPAASQELLRAGVLDRAEEFAADGEPGIARDLRQAEVGDPELPPQVQEQVARLDVAVHDAQLMSVLERERCLPAEVGHAVEAEATGLPNKRREALTIDELHRVIVDAALASDRVHRDDPLVLHVSRGQRLGPEPLEPTRVDGRGERQDLERDPPPE